MLDLLVLAAYFALTLGFGLKMGRRERSLAGFALADRQMPAWAVLFSIVATETTAATFLGTPGEGFTLRSYTYLQITFGLLVGRSVAAFLFLPVYYRMKVYSIYEFLGHRFGQRTRYAASLLFIVTRVLASGSRLYVAAIVLVVFFRSRLGGTELSAASQLSIYVVSVVAMTGLTAIYTSIGGIRAVIWTDVVQTTLMVGGAVVTIGLILLRLPHGAFHPLSYQFLDFGTGSSKPYTIWTGMIASVFITMATHGTDQDLVQRALTARDPKGGRLAMVLSGVAELPIVFLFLSIGILLSVYYQSFPDPSLPRKSSEVFAHFIVTSLPPGIRGGVIAAVFASAMGSLSAAMNALATSYTRDFRQGFFHSSSTNEASLRSARRGTLVFAGLLAAVALLVAAFSVFSSDARIIPIVLGIFGYTYGAILGLFLLGVLTKHRGTDRGNIFAVCVSVLVVLVASGIPGVTYPGWFPLIAFPWRILLGTTITLSIAACFGGKSASS